ncbi:MAG TPA: SURF1 family protein [Anaerolineales bacterium]|nr:SURF1 family protein [Anaerolineales bacterium]
MFLLRPFSRRWWFATLLVLAAAAVLIRLGIWQLDRLEQRRAFNAQVESARKQPALDLNEGQPADIAQMEWRAVQFAGEYDFANQVAVRNQYYAGQYGYHIMTPLLSQGIAVVVDRGWIPADSNSTPEDWRKYDVPGEVKVAGQIRLGQGKPAFGGIADALPADGSKLHVWNNANIEQIAHQLPYPILPVYIQQNYDPLDEEPPIPFQPTLELTEGSHFGYALQWFTFAAILLVGYPFFIEKQEARSA